MTLCSTSNCFIGPPNSILLTNMSLHQSHKHLAITRISVPSIHVKFISQFYAKIFVNFQHMWLLLCYYHSNLSTNWPIENAWLPCSLLIWSFILQSSHHIGHIEIQTITHTQNDALLTSFNFDPSSVSFSPSDPYLQPPPQSFLHSSQTNLTMPLKNLPLNPVWLLKQAINCSSSFCF